MKALITGGAGFIGSCLVDRLIEQQYQVAIIDNLTTGYQTYIPSSVTHYKTSITDPALDQIIEHESPDLVFHFAAQTSVRRSLLAPTVDAEINVQGSIQVVESCIRHNVSKVIYASTCAVYGEPQYLPVDEHHPIQPASPYGQTKHAGEQYLALAYQNHGLPYTALRFSNVYGNRQRRLGGTGVINIFAQSMRRGVPVTIFGDGSSTRDYIYIDDALDAILRSIPGRTPMVLNVGTRIATSLNVLYQLVKTEIESKHNLRVAAPEYRPANRGEVRHMTLNNTKLRDSLGWQFQTPIQAGIPQTIHD